MFGNRLPVSAVIDDLRDYCRDTAIKTLARLIELEANDQSLILGADQKQRFVDLWINTVCVWGFTEYDGQIAQLCRASAAAAISADPKQNELQLIAVNLVRRSQGAEGRSIEVSKSVFDEAFGKGAFDHSKGAGALTFALGSCLRYAQHLVKFYKVKF